MWIEAGGRETASRGPPWLGRAIKICHLFGLKSQFCNTFCCKSPLEEGGNSLTGGTHDASTHVTPVAMCHDWQPTMCSNAFSNAPGKSDCSILLSMTCKDLYPHMLSIQSESAVGSTSTGSSLSLAERCSRCQQSHHISRLTRCLDRNAFGATRSLSRGSRLSYDTPHCRMASCNHHRRALRTPCCPSCEGSRRYRRLHM